VMRSVTSVLLAVALVVGAAALLAGCPKQQEEQAAVTPSPAPTESSATPSGAAPVTEGSLTVTGSDTMVHLATAWAEAFMKENPKAEIAVNGGGSGVGLTALINGTTDVATASRQIKDEETKAGEAKGITPKENPVARDGIAVVVNPENPISELTIEQLKKIFTGAVTNWKDVGGNDEPIGLLSRESSSGTYEFFREHVMNKEDYSSKARLMPATSAIIEAVKQDKGAIGYVGLGYAIEAGDAVKRLKVKTDANAPAVEPTEETVKSGEYGIARSLYLYTNGEPQGLAKAYLDFALSDAGQKIVVEQGYVTLH
jgi:phosphate transport system substrate-binding protein